MGTQILPFTTNMDVRNQAKRLWAISIQWLFLLSLVK